jgi:hypothetical protein
MPRTLEVERLSYSEVLRPAQRGQARHLEQIPFDSLPSLRVISAGLERSRRAPLANAPLFLHPARSNFSFQAAPPPLALTGELGTLASRRVAQLAE